MRVNGRTLRYPTLAERRIFHSLGITELRVPRSMNPYTVARRIARAAKNNTPDLEFVKNLAQAKRPPHQVPCPPPDFELPGPVVPAPHEPVHAAAA